MKIIIAGCGKVGTTIAEQLTQEGHDISIIDENAEVIKRITDSYDVMGVIGNVLSYNLQKEAGVENADVLVAVTDSDESNMLTCLLAKKAGTKATIARVRNPVHYQGLGLISKDLGLSMTVNPELAAAAEAARILRFPSAIGIETFAFGKVELTTFRLPEDNMISGMSIMEIRKKIQDDILICVVEREKEVIIPNGSFVIRGGDNLSVIGAPKEVKDFIRNIGIVTPSIEDIMIVGGGRVGYYLALQLSNAGKKVKIIEKNRKRCEELAELLPDVVVINGDVTNEDVMLEEGITEMDAFVSATGLDEANAFLAAFAGKVKPGIKTITKMDKVKFDGVIDKFELGSIMNPKMLTAQRIIRFVRARQNSLGSNVESLYRMRNNMVEVLEFEISEDCPVKGIALKDMQTRENLLVAAIYRSGEVIYPNGQTAFEEGDRVVIATTQTGLRDIKDIIEK